MAFDKNQIVFPSQFQREVWWWAIGIVPLEESLTENLTIHLSDETIQGCRQWHQYFTTLTEDMYRNPEIYQPVTPRQYRDFLELIGLKGKISDSSLIFSVKEWEETVLRLEKSKSYRTQNLKINHILTPLSRLGLHLQESKDTVSFKIKDCDFIFYAMKSMEESQKVRDTLVRHHFAHCEFRQLVKYYNPGYGELLRKASDDSMAITEKLHQFCLLHHIKRSIHFGIIKYKYKNIRIFDYNLYQDDTPTLRLNITCLPQQLHELDGVAGDFFTRHYNKEENRFRINPLPTDEENLELLIKAIIDTIQ